MMQYALQILHSFVFTLLRERCPSNIVYVDDELWDVIEDIDYATHQFNNFLKATTKFRLQCIITTLIRETKSEIIKYFLVSACRI